jgi:uncharacterized ParB-like nuclease family protein
VTTSSSVVCVGKHSTNEVVSWLCCSATAVWDLGAAACEGVAAPVPSSYFHIDGEEATFYYSYETCSHDNSFTDSADDDQACKPVTQKPLPGVLLLRASKSIPMMTVSLGSMTC